LRYKNINVELGYELIEMVFYSAFSLINFLGNIAPPEINTKAVFVNIFYYRTGKMRFFKKI